MIVVLHSIVVLRAGFGGDDFADVLDQWRVPGGGHADRLGEHGRDAGAGDAVEAFVPPVVGGDAEPRNCRRGGDVWETFSSSVRRPTRSLARCRWAAMDSDREAFRWTARCRRSEGVQRR